jgi:hypothetical protein
MAVGRVLLLMLGVVVWFALGAAIRLLPPVLAIAIALIGLMGGEVVAVLAYVVALAVVVFYFSVLSDVTTVWFPSYRTTAYEQRQAHDSLIRRWRAVRSGARGARRRLAKSSRTSGLGGLKLWRPERLLTRRTTVRYCSGVEDALLQLREGCIHMAWDRAFTCLARVWPSTTPDHWWIDVDSKPMGELIPSAEVPAALALVDFHAQSWTVWRVDPKAQHPRFRLEQPTT